MNLPASSPVVAAVAGIALAVLLAGLLRVRADGPRHANAWLAGAVGSLALLVLGRLPGSPAGHLVDWLAFVFGPCLWLYACRVTGEVGPRGQRMAVHFIPAGAMLLVLLPRHADLAVPALRTHGAPDALYVVTALHMLAYWLLASLRLRRGDLPKLRTRLWVCLAVWAVWIATGY